MGVWLVGDLRGAGALCGGKPNEAGTFCRMAYADLVGDRARTFDRDRAVAVISWNLTAVA